MPENTLNDEPSKKASKHLSQCDAQVVIACGAIEYELSELHSQYKSAQIKYLDQNLHITPKKMSYLIQEQIDRVASHASQIILGYGLCAMGVVGVTARKQCLIIPRCHDCVGLFLGSPQIFNEWFSQRPGTYYLTPGWIVGKKDPLGMLEDDYFPKMAKEDAIWCMEEQLKHYTHICPRRPNGRNQIV